MKISRRHILLHLALVTAMLLFVVNIGGGVSQISKTPPAGSAPAPRLAVPQSKIINHTCTNLSVIPLSWITTVKTMKLHYCHRSHGGQLINGLDIIQNANNTFREEYSTVILPNVAGALCILDGQARSDQDSYILSEMYWASTDGRADTTNVVTTYSMNVSMWSWCNELESWDTISVDYYLANISAFEAANPETVFVYMTENAQSTDEAGYNRALRNKQIRDYCIANNKWLFDFEDLDAWCGTENNTYTYDGHVVPAQHSAYNCPECDVHVNEAGSRIKGIAVWWMLARIAGWDGTTYVTGPCPGGIPGFPVEWIFLNVAVAIGIIAILKKRVKFN